MPVERARWAHEGSAAMGVLSKFEAAMQGVVEGSFGRVFRARLQPAELANKLTRAMEDNLQISSDRRLAPNVYDIFLSRRDYEHFMPTFDSLPRRLAAGVIGVARARSYTLTTRPLLRFHLDENVITGQARVGAQTVDARALPSQPALGENPDATQALTAEEARELAQQNAEAARSEAPPPAWLTLYRPTRRHALQL